MTEGTHTEVKMHSANHVVSSTALASGPDFCRIFTEKMKDLYLLGWLLTGDGEKAEQCFVSGLGDCVKGNAVFKEWAQSWARRNIIQNAIRMMAPVEKHPAAPVAVPEGIYPLVAGPEIRVEFEAIMKLEPLERFVFIMSVLEGYSYQDCAILLGCARQRIISTREQALKRLARAAQTSMVVAGEAGVAAAPWSN